MNINLISDLYKEVQYRDQQVQYHAGIEVGGCAFSFFVNDMPVEQYYGSKLASLQLPYKPPGFVYEPQLGTQDGMGITLTTLFQRKIKCGPLSVIR